MLKNLKYLIIIRFRKLFAKDDFLAIGLFLLATVVLCYFFQVRYSHYANYLLFFALQILTIHINREDLEFLKLSPKYKLILVLEYAVLSCPVLILLLLNLKISALLVYLIAVFAITFVNKSTSKTIKDPFKMFDPFWVITFRKNKLFLLLPVLLFIAYMGFKHQNPNLYYAVLLVAGIILCAPANEREKISFIKASTYIGRDYIFKQIKTILYNSIFILLPIAIVFLALQQFQILLFIPLLLILPIVNMLFKYVFFERKIIHNLFFALFLGNLMFGYPLVFIPYLYKKAILNLKIMQYA